jgi:hypothetical protein
LKKTHNKEDTRPFCEHAIIITLQFLQENAAETTKYDRKEEKPPSPRNSRQLSNNALMRNSFTHYGSHWTESSAMGGLYRRQREPASKHVAVVVLCDQGGAKIGLSFTYSRPLEESKAPPFRQ